MAVPSSSPSRSAKPQSPKPKLMKHQSSSNTKTKSKSKSEIDIAIGNENPNVIAPKRTKSPGVRLVGGRIYDSQNGKTCHQCRQKTMDFTASCNNVIKGKQCTIRFCHKCLFNRYGEKAEEKALLDDWHCPKCRGKCNCSFCMKKSGQKPTGILIHTAKASGFSSVSEMLDVRGPQCITDELRASPKKVLSPKKGKNTKKDNKSAYRKDDKENSKDGLNKLKLQFHSSMSDLNVVKPKKRKHAHLKVTSEKSTNDAGSVEKNVHTNKNSEDELQITENASSLDPNSAPVKKRKKKIVAQTEKYKMATSLESRSVDEESIKMNGTTKNNAVENVQIEDTDSNGKTHSNMLKIHTKNLVNKEVEVDLSLPVGNDSITVGGSNPPSGNVGQALQFLEFCAAFGKVFNMRKGQAEAIIREIFRGRERRRAQYSASVQFHMELISLIQKEFGEKFSKLSPTMGKNSWLHAALKCISSSSFRNAFTNFPSTSEGYDALDSSGKLMLLNFLCDEALDTEKLRSWIEHEYCKSLEQEKQAREKVATAKENKRVAKRKMQDELAKAIIAKNGKPLTISEHETIVSQIKSDAEEALAQMVEAKGALPNNEPRSDAVRTEPLFVDINGNSFWRLKSCSDELGILLQEMKENDETVQCDHWLSYDAEQMSTLEKYMNSRRPKKQRSKACSS